MAFGMPASMLLVFVLVVLAGSLGAIHYGVVHVILGRPFADEDEGTTSYSAPPGAGPTRPGTAGADGGGSARPPEGPAA